MPAPRDSSQGVWNTFGFLTKVKYGGVLGKIAALGIVFFLFLCVLAFAAHTYKPLLWGLLFAGTACLVFVVLRMEAIFKLNPEMATLEGTEVIRYRQLELKSKDERPIQIIELTNDPELLNRSPINDPPELDMPEESE